MKDLGFTLIELLIVVAIIAILAAIAVPNFLEAQTRSKISRVLADFRSIRTALESYRIDNPRYPETDTGSEDLMIAGVGMIRLTTPMAFMTSIPKTPFKEDKMGYSGTPKNCNKYNIPLYVRAAMIGAVSESKPADIDPDYISDRRAYLKDFVGDPVPNSAAITGYWMLKSVGPDNVDNRDTTQTGEPAINARVYDPTNGTVSKGDIIVFGDYNNLLGR